MAGRRAQQVTAYLHHIAVAVDGNPAFGHAQIAIAATDRAGPEHASMVRLVRVDRHRLAIVQTVRKQRHASRWLAAYAPLSGDTFLSPASGGSVCVGLNRRLNRGCTGGCTGG